MDQKFTDELTALVDRIVEATAAPLRNELAAQTASLERVGAENAQLLAEVERLRAQPGQPAPSSKVMWGMASPRDQWSARLGEVGEDRVQSRRLFATSPTALAGILREAHSEVAAGRYPIVSMKLPSGMTWAQAAKGAFDEGFDQVGQDLALLQRGTFAVHHEPVNDPDGSAADYVAMTLRWMGRVRPLAPHIDLSTIVNGFMWSAKAQGFTDDAIAAWLPDELLEAADITAADCYHGGTPAKPLENAGVKIERMSAWATRKGVKRLGIGEFNGLSASAITHAMDAVRSDGRFVYAAIYNSNVNNREGIEWVLTGERLEAFRAGALRR